MLFGGHAGELELRRAGDGGARLRGRFPYGATAVLSDGGRHGRPRKERIAPRAFSYRVELPNEDISLLVGHDFGQPLASKKTGTLALRDTPEALTFDATISRDMVKVSWVRDILAAINAGLAVGVSPGFRLPPARAVEKVEEIEEEPVEPEKGNHGAIIRLVLQALLYELSVVTRPAYPEAQVELRNWSLTDPPAPALHRALNRWRP